MSVELVIFAVIAVVVLFQLYNVLGRRVGFKVEDKPTPRISEDGDGPVRIEKKPEAPKFPNLEALKARDPQFNEINFIEKARETYEGVVVAFTKGDVDPVKDRLADNVYNVFSKAVQNRDPSAPKETVTFVDGPKVDMELIDFKDDFAHIRVRFLSELLYQTEAAKPAEQAVPETDVLPVPAEAKKTHKRTAEYWTFHKNLKSGNNPWLLAKVEAAKA
ncbi:Tim44/TimA family putative adaptor protein [Asticcacaulis sp. SL142]|uniref:Tim44/TimA family putative adaptor protein n=1 Tax=Asticcacaulis sp. SL142 TaxID=2995155 RepID=UPI00226D24FA|nr:Tim44/TimA family putative adaptor protein [Asticcacaulis sp. SL142]WAC47302.1 Tim44/TimA family putative adaptor protein [Asticcacaulis sp. SL142]